MAIRTLFAAAGIATALMAAAFVMKPSSAMSPAPAEWDDSFAEVMLDARNNTGRRIFQTGVRWTIWSRDHEAHYGNYAGHLVNIALPAGRYTATGTYQDLTGKRDFHVFKGTRNAIPVTLSPARKPTK